MIPCQRHLFDIPEDVAYFNCAYMSPLLREVREAGERGMARKAQPWKIRPADFFSDSERARGLFAELVNAAAGDVAIIPSASYGVGVAAANLPVKAGQRLLVLADQFPSNLYPWRELAAERGAELVTVARPADGDWTRATLAAIDERTALAALPHCHWTDGGLLDLAAIGARLRAIGAALVIDGTQSVGALPFDVRTIRPDFLIVATYKWLLGPYSLGFLYAAPERQAGRPLEYGWITRAGSEDFAGLVQYRDEFQPGARRYDMGERSNFALMPMAIAALQQLLAWKVAETQASLRACTDRIAERARRLGLQVSAPSLRAGHFLGVRFAGGVPPDLPDRLAAQQIYVSVRGDAMRITPHLYNNDTDIERLFAMLAAAI